LLVRIQPEDHILVLVVHHIVSDGWSLGVLLGELRLGYQAHAAGQRWPQLAAVPSFFGWRRA